MRLYETIGYIDGSTGIMIRMKNNIDYMNGYRRGLQVYIRTRIAD